MPVLTAPNVGVLLLPVDEIPVGAVVFMFSAENKQNITLTAPDKHTNKMSDIHTEKIPHAKKYQIIHNINLKHTSQHNEGNVITNWNLFTCQLI